MKNMFIRIWKLFVCRINDFDSRLFVIFVVKKKIKKAIMQLFHLCNTFMEKSLQEI